MESFEPKNWYNLTKEQRASAVKYLMYLKEKYDGNLKGRGCADGWPQQPYTSKSEGSSSTLTLTGLIITCIIDAYKRRDITTVDIPRAFLQTKMPQDKKEIHVVSDRRMAELLTKISPETYQEYIHQKHCQAYIYCKQNVALHGTSRQLCYSGRGWLKAWRYRVLLLIHTTGASPTKWLMDINSPLHGMLMISRFHTSVRRWSGKLLIPWKPSMERWVRWQ